MTSLAVCAERSVWPIVARMERSAIRDRLAAGASAPGWRGTIACGRRPGSPRLRPACGERGHRVAGPHAIAVPASWPLVRPGGSLYNPNTNIMVWCRVSRSSGVRTCHSPPTSRRSAWSMPTVSPATGWWTTAPTTPRAIRRSTRSIAATSRTSSLPMRSRSAAPRRRRERKSARRRKQREQFAI